MPRARPWQPNSLATQRAGRGIRTLTGSPPTVFETAASTVPPARPGTIVCEERARRARGGCRWPNRALSAPRRGGGGGPRSTGTQVCLRRRWRGAGWSTRRATTTRRGRSVTARLAWKGEGRGRPSTSTASRSPRRAFRPPVLRIPRRAHLHCRCRRPHGGQGAATFGRGLPTTYWIEEAGSVVNSGRWMRWKDPVLSPEGQARHDHWILADLLLGVRRCSGSRAAAASPTTCRLTMDDADPARRRCSRRSRDGCRR
jgi:hypothetical protein